MAAEQPRDGDLVAGRFDDRTADKLTAAGVSSLGELNAQIADGGRWYRSMLAVGEAKAQRIAKHLATLLPAPPRVLRLAFTLTTQPSPVSTSASVDAALIPPRPPPSPPPGDRVRFLDVDSDSDAIETCIAALAGFTATTNFY